MWVYRTNELYHHGIKGMKWGVRRYQNEDGSLTKAGKKKYAKLEKKVVSKGKLNDNHGDYLVTKYSNKKGTSSGIKTFDSMVKKNKTDEAKEKYTSVANDFIKNLKSKGEEYAMEKIMKDIGDTPFNLYVQKDTYEKGKEEVTYSLEVFGSKNIFGKKKNAYYLTDMGEGWYLDYFTNK